MVRDWLRARRFRPVGRGRPRLSPGTARWRTRETGGVQPGQFVDAWNNLGNVLAELGEADEAVEALEKALELDPDYGDAHYNLADVLDSQGRKEQAAEHWRSYLRQQPVGPWSDYARRRLRMDRA
ncbi:MAG: tetratricopeptide repeat protein [Planctomycetota bacterium]|nr:MAG: tetratricopeptide repeat protein [Planctomycetota bacterium]